MKIAYYEDTDTLYIEFSPGVVVDTRDLDEDDDDVLLERDVAGRLCAVTIERARARAAMPAFSYERIAGGRLTGSAAAGGGDHDSSDPPRRPAR